MKKTNLLKVLVLAIALVACLSIFLVSCGDCEHTGGTATCTEKAVCDECGEEYGDVAAHTFSNATCTVAKTCTACNATEGSALGHDWAAASCDAPKTCKRCQETEGEALTHSWVDASCTEPKHCENCDAREGRPNGHDWVEANCQNPLKCSTCGETDGESDPNSHVWVDASCAGPKNCSVCGITEGVALPHTSKDGKCQFCEIDMPKITLEDIESITPSHEGGGAANVEKLFDGEKATTGIYTIGDKEYSPNAVGDSIVITLKEECYVNEIILWITGNYSPATFELYDADGKVVYTRKIEYQAGDTNGGQAGAEKITLDTAVKVKSLRILHYELKWSSGKTAKTAEIEIFVNSKVNAE